MAQSFWSISLAVRKSVQSVVFASDTGKIFEIRVMMLLMALLQRERLV